MKGKRIVKKTRSRKKIICFLFVKSIFYSIFAVTKKEYWNMKNLETRTSIRKYAQREVSNQLLHRLLSQAERTQTMGNLQLYSVVITRSEAQKAALAPAHFNQPMVTGAPVVLTFCADFRRTSRWAEERNAQPGYDNFLSFINAATDALLYCQTFCNLADEEGLGYCYLGTTVYMPKQIIDVLKLPKLVMPVATITLGWPDEQPAQSDRLPLEAIIHDEHYEDYDRSRIDRFYTAKEQLPENQEFLRINNKETLAQIFTDIRYTKKDNEAMSEGLLETLKQQGFM
jgi:FMN reductase [NAD(P)H]